jgi:hypothetical protein
VDRRIWIGVLLLGALGCGGAADGRGGAVGAPGPGVTTWPALYWVNSNSGPTFSWTIDGLAAAAWVAAPMNGTPAADGTGCVGFGGNVAPGVAARSMAQALPPGATLRLWMQPKDLEFDGVATPDLGPAAAERLQAFQACVAQDWPDAPVVSGFLCVREQRLGGDANCDTLAAAFAGGAVPAPSGGASVAYGILGAPGDMNRTDVAAALGEMYEPPYFAPSGTCAPSSDGASYGGEIGAWLASAAVVPASGSVAVPAFGGPSATCPLDYDQLVPAAAALAEQAPPGLAGVAVWG